MEPQDKIPDPVDVHVGGRLKALRKERKLSQTKVADFLGLTFQQVQKYERGANRIGAGRLYRLAQFLHVPVSYFFEGLDQSASTEEDAIAAALPDTDENGELIPFARHYYSIKDPRIRKKILGFIRAMAGEADEDENAA